MKVPNIVHFIWLTGPHARPFSYINYLAVKAVAKIHKPDSILMHCNLAPVGNRHWDRAKQYFTLVPCAAPAMLGGTPIRHVQYQSDVLRMGILIRQGGVYIDTDMILLRPLHDLMNVPLTLAEESPTSIANGVILAAPKSQFLQIWLDKMPQALQSPTWAYHAVVLPVQLFHDFPHLVTVRGPSYFFPLDLKRNYLCETDPSQIEESVSRIGPAHGIHVYESYWKGYLDEIKPENMGGPSLFAKLFGHLEVDAG